MPYERENNSGGNTCVLGSDSALKNVDTLRTTRIREMCVPEMMSVLRLVTNSELLAFSTSRPIPRQRNLSHGTHLKGPPRKLFC